MSYIINPYRYGAGDDPPGGDYVTITVDSSLTIEEDMYDSDYKYFVVDSPLSSAFTASGSNTIEVYLIAGGGGGGSNTYGSSGSTTNGAAGAGGYLRELSYDNGGALDQVYNVTIGAGGATDTDGDDSVLTPVSSGSVKTAVGGGAGGGYDWQTGNPNGTWGSGYDGGSGGGGSYYYNADTYGMKGYGTAGQGNDGGHGPNSSGDVPYIGGGGGGAGAAGAKGGTDGAGGDGVQYEWMDDTYNMLGPDGDGYFAGGGGGGGYGYGSASGGSGGGGTGGDGSNGGDDGDTNSGGGGGGSGASYGYDGGSGGSGYLIVRWKFQN